VAQKDPREHPPFGVQQRWGESRPRPSAHDGRFRGAVTRATTHLVDKDWETRTAVTDSTSSVSFEIGGTPGTVSVTEPTGPYGRNEGTTGANGIWENEGLVA
jgi:hypothetical protein